MQVSLSGESLVTSTGNYKYSLFSLHMKKHLPRINRGMSQTQSQSQTQTKTHRFLAFVMLTYFCTNESTVTRSHLNYYIFYFLISILESFFFLHFELLGDIAS